MESARPFGGGFFALPLVAAIMTQHRDSSRPDPLFPGPAGPKAQGRPPGGFLPPLTE